MKRGLGEQGPGVLSRARRPPGVLAPPGDPAKEAARRAGVDRQRLAGMMRDLTAAREDLAEALEAWETAVPDAAGRVAAIRRRHGIAVDEPDPESDLTDASGKS